MASATIDQATYAKALERAHTDGLQIIGRGHRKSDNVMVVFVTGKSRASYQVAVFPTRMVCNCQASGYCKHRALVREDLAARRAAVVAAQVASIVEAPVVKVAPKLVACRGINDTAPISIWK